MLCSNNVMPSQYQQNDLVMKQVAGSTNAAIPALHLPPVHQPCLYIGYGCSIASFEKGELGEAVPEAELPEHIRERVTRQAGPVAVTPHPAKSQAPPPSSASMPPPPSHQASLPGILAYPGLHC